LSAVLKEGINRPHHSIEVEEDGEEIKRQGMSPDICTSVDEVLTQYAETAFELSCVFYQI